MQNQTKRKSPMYSLSVKREAVRLRRKGKSHTEIQKILGVSRGTAYRWTAGIVLTDNQKACLQENVVRGTRASFTRERREFMKQWARKKLSPYVEKYTKEDLLHKIRNFYFTHGRIPMKREFNMFHEYKRRFGSWNAAIRLAGFSPNPSLFAYKFIAQDGHKCDSFSEKIIDDWLFANRITHKRNASYVGTKMTADFILKSGTFVEFFGLAGVQKNYDRILERKRAFCARQRIHLVEIYPKDLFPQNRLSSLIDL